MMTVVGYSSILTVHPDQLDQVTTAKTCTSLNYSAGLPEKSELALEEY
jgi:hypothetical protein